MENKVTAVRWTQKALDSLQAIHDFYAMKSAQAANRVVDDVFETAESIVFVEQYQIDEYRKDCRRMICRHFKILYKAEGSTVNIVDIFDTRSTPE